MVLTYQRTIAGAFRDAFNALISLNKHRAAREQQEKLVAAAQDATRLSRMRYQGGATSYLEILTTDSTLLSAQLNLVAAQQAEARTRFRRWRGIDRERDFFRGRSREVLVGPVGFEPTTNGL